MHSTSLSLLVRLRQRDASDASDAWTRFAQLYTPLLFYWAKRLGFSSSAADDLVQELLIHLWSKLSQFEHRGVGSFRNWLRTVATNKAREHLRKKTLAAGDGETGKFTQLADDGADDPFWETEYRQHLVSRALELMQSEFAPATWQACWQRVVEDRAAAEVAKSLGISEAAVYVYTGRVLRRLREVLIDLLD